MTGSTRCCRAIATGLETHRLAGSDGARASTSRVLRRNARRIAEGLREGGNNPAKENAPRGTGDQRRRCTLAVPDGSNVIERIRGR